MWRDEREEERGVEWMRRRCGGERQRTNNRISHALTVLSMRTLILIGYHDNDPNSDLTSNQIVFEVAVTMNDHVYNTTSPYTVGFTLWTMDANSVEIMWSAQEAVQATADSLPSLVYQYYYCYYHQ